jgi:FtsH-binding integral membrane protein
MIRLPFRSLNFKLKCSTERQMKHNMMKYNHHLKIFNLSKMYLSSSNVRLKQTWENTNKKEKWETSQDTQDTQNNGLSNFLKRVAISTAGGLAFTSTVTSFLIGGMGLNHLISYASIYILGGFVCGLGSASAITFLKPIYQTDKSGNFRAITRIPRVLSFGVLSGSMGVMIAPAMALVVSEQPEILLASAVITASTMGGIIHYSMRTNKNILQYGPALHIGLWALIGNGVISLFLGVPEPMFFIDCIGGTLLFTGITAYDTQRAIEAYKLGRPDHIGHAANFYLDFMNLFLRILEILAKIKED